MTQAESKSTPMQLGSTPNHLTTLTASSAASIEVCKNGLMASFWLPTINGYFGFKNALNDYQTHWRSKKIQKTSSEQEKTRNKERPKEHSIVCINSQPPKSPNLRWLSSKKKSSQTPKLPRQIFNSSSTFILLTKELFFFGYLYYLFHCYNKFQLEIETSG